MVADRRVEQFSNMGEVQRLDFDEGHILEVMSPLVARIAQAHLAPPWS
jgi:hypothetical protein